MREHVPRALAVLIAVLAARARLAYEKHMSARRARFGGAPAARRKTLDRALSRLGACSRSEAPALIRAGRVRVNGLIARDPEAWVDPLHDAIELDGARLALEAARVWMLHKPAGWLTSTRSEHGHPTVGAKLAELPLLARAVGRLDLETSGLLLATNDPELAARLSAPESGLAKVYRVRTVGRLSDAQLAALAAGPLLRDGPARPLWVKRVPPARDRIELALDEGRNREVRRMLLAIGSEVRALERIAYGPLELGSLAAGEIRELSARELRALREALAERK
jgi:23S rRNA pseudouridine2605 synthase